MDEGVRGGEVVPGPPLSSAFLRQRKGDLWGGPCPWDPVWGMCGVSLASCTLWQGSPHPSLLSSTSDYVIDDKVAVLQKRDHEGFGFVLRGAKGKEG